MKTISIGFIWKLRLMLRAKGNTLWAKGNTLWAEGDTLKAEGDTLRAEAVIAAYGNVTIEWHSNTKCTVDGTDVFDDIDEKGNRLNK